MNKKEKKELVEHLIYYKIVTRKNWMLISEEIRLPRMTISRWVSQVALPNQVNTLILRDFIKEKRDQFESFAAKTA